MRIDRATIDDAADILTLQVLAYQSEAAIYNDYEIPPLTQTIDQLKAEFAAAVFLKACESRRIVGSVRGYSQDRTCLIGRVIVHPDYQGRGVGTQLMERMEERFSGVERFELFTGDRSTRNLRFYHALGYRQFRTERVNAGLTFVYLEKTNDTGRTAGGAGRRDR